MSGYLNNSDDSTQDELERLLTEGIGAYKIPGEEGDLLRHPSAQSKNVAPRLIVGVGSDEDEDEETSSSLIDRGSDIQGALGLFAEATQDMATAGVELGLGRHFACVDFCNQAVEKAAQAVSLLRFGRRSMYNHDLRALGATVGAPQEIQDEMALLTPFHPETFYVETPPEEADEVISAEQASSYIQHARHILKWAKNIVLYA